MTKRSPLHPLDPVYQYPGRLELTNINDAFGKKDRVQQAILDRHNAKATLKQAAESSLMKIDKPPSAAVSEAKSAMASPKSALPSPVPLKSEVSKPASPPMS